MDLSTLISMSAGVQFIVFRMVLLLLPAMAVQTLELIGAPVFITANELPGSPIHALLL